MAGHTEKALGKLLYKVVSDLNCQQFGKEYREKYPVTFSMNTIIASYLCQMPAKIGSYRLSSDFFNLYHVHKEE